MKNLKDIISESVHETDERELMILDNDEFYALMLDKTTGQIQIYSKPEPLIDDWEDQLDGFTVSNLKRMKAGVAHEFGAGNYVLFKF